MPIRLSKRHRPCSEKAKNFCGSRRKRLRPSQSSVQAGVLACRPTSFDTASASRARPLVQCTIVMRVAERETARSSVNAATLADPI